MVSVFATSRYRETVIVFESAGTTASLVLPSDQRTWTRRAGFNVGLPKNATGADCE
jgi:hypothetical protein